ncbi:MAG: GGDEF domain-containing protein [Clostridiales bacterium]|nr:GGDEF domain-containing protein [Clostridiales bacterium]
MAPLQYFSAILIFHLLLIAAMLVLIVKNNMLPKKRTLDLVVVLVIIAVTAVIEFLFEYFFAERLLSPDALERIYPVTKFSFAVIIFFFLRLMSYDRKYLFALAVPALEIVLMLIGQANGIGINITEDYVLDTGIMVNIVAVINVAFYIYQQVLVIAENKRHQNTSYFVYGFMSLTLLAGRIIQWVYPQSKVFLFSVTITALLYTIFLANNTKQTDEITKLLNRDSFDNNLNRTPVGAIIMIYDIDYFKKVNDNNGHDYGDEVLEKVGRMLMTVYSKSGKSYRIGGDEFTVILTKNKDFFRSMTQIFDDMVEKERKADPRFPTISMGYAIQDGSGSIEKIFNDADTKMYENKNIRKAGMGHTGDIPLSQ